MNNVQPAKKLNATTFDHSTTLQNFDNQTVHSKHPSNFNLKDVEKAHPSAQQYIYKNFGYDINELSFRKPIQEEVEGEKTIFNED